MLPPSLKSTNELESFLRKPSYINPSQLLSYDVSLVLVLEINFGQKSPERITWTQCVTLKRGTAADIPRTEILDSWAPQATMLSWKIRNSHLITHHFKKSHLRNYCQASERSSSLVLVWPSKSSSSLFGVGALLSPTRPSLVAYLLPRQVMNHGKWWITISPKISRC